MNARKFTRLVTCAPETRKDLPAGAIEDFDLLVVFIDDVDELLLSFGEKSLHAQLSLSYRA